MIGVHGTTKIHLNEEKCMPTRISDQDNRIDVLGQRVYTKEEVKGKKHSAGISGLIIGVLSTLAAGVIANKVAKVNITDETTKLVDSGIDKIKKIKSKKNNPEVSTQQ
jgi:hypothetical protein